MQYLLLIYGNEKDFDKLTHAERQGVTREYTEFTKSIAQSGHLRGGNELQPVACPRRVGARDKKRPVPAGPFASSK